MDVVVGEDAGGEDGADAVEGFEGALGGGGLVLWEEERKGGSPLQSAIRGRGRRI